MYSLLITCYVGLYTSKLIFKIFTPAYLKYIMNITKWLLSMIYNDLNGINISYIQIVWIKSKV